MTDVKAEYLRDYVEWAEAKADVVAYWRDKSLDEKA